MGNESLKLFPEEATQKEVADKSERKELIKEISRWDPEDMEEIEVGSAYINLAGKNILLITADGREVGYEFDDNGDVKKVFDRQIPGLGSIHKTEISGDILNNLEKKASRILKEKLAGLNGIIEKEGKVEVPGLPKNVTIENVKIGEEGEKTEKMIIIRGKNYKMYYVIVKDKGLIVQPELMEGHLTADEEDECIDLANKARRYWERLMKARKDKEK